MKYIKSILVGDPNCHNDKRSDNIINSIENMLAIPVVSSNNKIELHDATSLEEISINNRFNNRSSIEYQFHNIKGVKHDHINS